LKILRWIWIAIIAILVVYLGVEELWYFGYGGYRFASVHAWGTFPPGMTVKLYLLLGIVGFAIVTEVISLIVNQRRQDDTVARESDKSVSSEGETNHDHT
jgi:mannose/fructose/N-acetylgalactosamine-specific phosphotransferase system component IIC